MPFFKVGDRAIIIKSVAGDEGIIVEITGFYTPWQKFNDTIWDDQCDVIVKTLGGPLHSVNIITGDISSHMERPYRSRWLRKLPDLREEQEEIRKASSPVKGDEVKAPVKKKCEVCDG